MPQCLGARVIALQYSKYILSTSMSVRSQSKIKVKEERGKPSESFQLHKSRPQPQRDRLHSARGVDPVPLSASSKSLVSSPSSPCCPFSDVAGVSIRYST